MNMILKGETCIELIAGDFRALIAPFNGSNVMKLENTALQVDILRNDLSLSPEELKGAAEVYGHADIVSSNRLSHGNLKTSDAMYHFPCNDPLGNHLHGFLHKRRHQIDAIYTEDDCAVAKKHRMSMTKRMNFIQHFLSASRQSSYLL